MEGILYAIKPVVIAIVVQALVNLARTGVKSKFLGLLAVSCVILSAVRLDPLVILLCGGIASRLYIGIRQRWIGAPGLLPISSVSLAIGTATVDAVTVAGLFFSFLKMGAIVFGSGYVLLAFLRTEFIVRLHWLTEKQLIDAVAVGQFTPGPVFTTATFLGYVLAGIPGAVAATIAIFLPGFLLVAVSGPLVSRVRTSPTAGAVFDGVVVASVSLMAVVSCQLARAALVDWLTLVLAAISLLLLTRFRVSLVWLILAAALIGGIARSSILETAEPTQFTTGGRTKTSLSI